MQSGLRDVSGVSSNGQDARGIERASSVATRGGASAYDTSREVKNMTWEEMEFLMQASQALLYKTGGGMVILPSATGLVGIVHESATVEDKIKLLVTGITLLMKEDKLSRTDMISRLNERLQVVEKHNVQMGVLI